MIGVRDSTTNGAANRSVGGFVFSLDFELMWGVYGTHNISDYGKNIVGVRKMVPRMLDLLSRYKLGCTWATVGFLFCSSRDELLACLPPIRPAYHNPRISAYSYLHEVGTDERRDPHHFAPSLIAEIAARPRQEIATHTLSHYYCLEEGQTAEAFAADLSAALSLAAAKGYRINSIVFPRNQVSETALAICRGAGLTIYRGASETPSGIGIARSQERLSHRAIRLIDAYIETGARTNRIVRRQNGMINVPASLFLRPYSRQLAFADAVKLERILGAMRRAAQSGGLFHLWFHPHNFGVDQDENFALMTAIAAEAARLRDQHGWPTLNMAEAAALVGARASVSEVATVNIVNA